MPSLHFPNLAPADFQPWINPTEARREGQTVEEAAEQTAVLWRNGLAKWEIQPERIQQLADSVQFSVYTPGSDAGLPISILASLKAPELDWEENKELLREQIAGTITALLGLIGLKDIDPVRSREHILLSNIFEHNWSAGKDLDLASLIMQVQTPPFKKLGVFDVNTFFPEKDRFELAMLLNNILAAPHISKLDRRGTIGRQPFALHKRRPSAPHHLLHCPPTGIGKDVFCHLALFRCGKLDAYTKWDFLIKSAHLLR